MIGYFDHVTSTERRLDNHDHVMSIMIINCMNSGKMSCTAAMYLSANFRNCVRRIWQQLSILRTHLQNFNTPYPILNKYVIL